MQPQNESQVASTESLQLLPFFLYGSLMSSTLLAGLITGDERKAKLIAKRMKPATLPGYSRHLVRDADFPAVIPGAPTGKVNGYLFQPDSMKEVELLDDFECESYYREEVEVVKEDGGVVLAYVYLWCDELEDLAEEDWNFEQFEAKWSRNSD